MRKLIIFVFGFILILLSSCSKEIIEPDQNGDLKDLTSGKYGTVKPHGQVFTVAPSDDATQALIDAFAAAKEAGPGSVVQLEEGTYTIGMISVNDFYGYLLGAGKGKSIISNLPLIPCESAWQQNSIPCLLRFVGGNVTVSDLTFHLNDGPACAPGGTLNDQIYGSDIAAIIVLSDFSGTYLPENPYIKGTVDNVEFIGGDDGGAGVYSTPGNVSMPIYCGGDAWFPADWLVLSNADISITRCYFELGLAGPDLSGLNENSSVYIADNVMVNEAFTGMYLGTFVGAKAIVKNNIFKNTGFLDLYIDDYDFGLFTSITSSKRAEYTITGNKFESAPGAISIYLRDYLIVSYPDKGLLPQLFDIEGNTITTQEGGIAVQCLNSADAKIWNNRFLGTGIIGVMIEGDEATQTYAESNKIISNNFLNAVYTDGNVSLGTYTKNCTVVGVPTDKVVDLGVNNKVIGVNAQKKGPHYQPGMNGQMRVMQENMLKMKSARTL